MKHLALLLFFALSLQAQIFGPAARLRKGAGDPSAGECASASDVGKVWVKTDTGDDSYPLSVCANTGVGTYGWVAAGSGSGGSGDITGVTAGTGLTGGGTSGGVTLSLATVTASRALASDGSGYPTASSVTATELGYLSGVSSAIQTQLGTKVGGASSLSNADRIMRVASSGTATEAGWAAGSTGIICSSGDGNSAACDMGTTGARLRNVTAAGTGTFAAGIASGWTATIGGAAEIAGDIIGSSTSCIYLGATGTDGSWRFCRDSGNVVFAKRESGSWVTKQTIIP